MLKMFKSETSRSGNVKKNVIFIFIIKGFSILISFLYVPLLLHSLDDINYGIWLTLTSILSWISFFDIGIGNGLRNKLADAIAHNDYYRGKCYVSTAYVCISLISLLLIVLFFLSSYFVSWKNIINAQTLSNADATTLVQIVALAFCLNFIFGLINLILYAVQKSAYSTFCSFISQLISYLVVLILVKIYNVNSLLILGSVVSFVPPFVLMCISIYLFNSSLKKISPSFGCYNYRYIKDILSLGIKFFIIQMCTLVLFQANNLIITHTVGNADVVVYNVAYKYMHIIVMFFSLIMVPMWSATTDAYSKGDMVWIRKINNRIIKIAFLFIAIGCIMFITSPVVYRLWLNDSSVEIPYLTTFLLYIYCSLNVIYNAYGHMLNGMSKLRIQLVVTSITAILYIPIAVYLGRIWGLNGILYAFSGVSLINALWSSIQFKKIISGSNSPIWNS